MTSVWNHLVKLDFEWLSCKHFQVCSACMWDPTVTIPFSDFSSLLAWVAWQTFYGRHKTQVYSSQKGCPRESNIRIHQSLNKKVTPEYGWEVTYWQEQMTQRYLHYQSPPSTVNQLIKAGNLELTALLASSSESESVCSRWLCLSGPLPGSSAGLCLFQAVGQFSASFWLLGLSDSQQSLLFTYSWRGRNLLNLVSFRDFLKLFELLTSCLNGASLKDGMFHFLINILS